LITSKRIDKQLTALQLHLVGNSSGISIQFNAYYVAKIIITAIAIHRRVAGYFKKAGVCQSHINPWRKQLSRGHVICKVNSWYDGLDTGVPASQFLVVMYLRIDCPYSQKKPSRQRKNPPFNLAVQSPKTERGGGGGDEFRIFNVIAYCLVGR